MELSTRLFLVSVALVVVLVVSNRSLWLPSRRARAWWRASVLTGSEDLRVGATVVAATAALAAGGGLLAADGWRDRVGSVRPVHALVVASSDAGVTVAVPAANRRRLLQLDAASVGADIGDVERVYLGRHGAVADDEPPSWNVWTGGCLSLLTVAGAAAAGSFSRRARWRLVPHRM